jgi:hypothetical protein
MSPLHDLQELLDDVLRRGLRFTLADTADLFSSVQRSNIASSLRCRAGDRLQSVLLLSTMSSCASVPIEGSENNAWALFPGHVHRYAFLEICVSGRRLSNLRHLSSFGVRLRYVPRAIEKATAWRLSRGPA